MLRFKRSKLVVALILGLVILVYRHIFKLQAHAAGDLSFFFDPNLRELLLPYVWKNSPGFGGLGDTTIPTLWIYPTFVMFAVANLLTKLPFQVIFPMLFGVVFLSTAFFSMYSLSLKFSLSKEGAAIASLFYLVNSYILLVVDGGQLGVAYGYALFPLVFLSFIKIIDKVKSNWGLSLILFGILSYLDLRVFLLSCLLCLIYSSFNLRKIWGFKRKFISWLILLGLFLVSIHFYWLTPLIGLKDQLMDQLPSMDDFRNLSFVTLKDGLLLFQPHWPLNVFGKLSLPGLFFCLIPIISFLPLFFRKDRRVLAVFWISLIAIFMVKGSNPPLGVVNEWIFINVPGMALFRDSSKFFIPLALSFAIFWGTAYDLIADWLKHLYSPRLKINSSFASLSVFLVLAVLIILPVRAVFEQSLTGMLGSSVRGTSFEEITNMIKGDQSFFRTLWAPEKPVYGYSDTLRPALSPKSLSDIRSFQLLSQGRYDLFEFIRSPLSDQLLRLVGVKYLFFSENFSRDNHKLSFQDYARSTTRFLDRLPWLVKTQTGSINTYQLQNPQDKFTSFDKLFLIDGSQDIYQELQQVQPEFLTKNVFLFLDQLHPSVLEKLIDTNSGKIFVISSSKEDLRLNIANINTTNALESGNWGEKSDQSADWIQLLKEQSVLLHSDRQVSQSVFFSTIPGEKLKFELEPKKEAYLKLFFNRRGGDVGITSGLGKQIINTKSFEDSFRWVKIGVPGEDLELENINGFNAVKTPLQINPNLLTLIAKVSNLSPNIYYQKSITLKSASTPIIFEQDLSTEDIKKRSQSKIIYKEEGQQEIAIEARSVTSDLLPVVGDRVFDVAVKAGRQPVTSVLVHFYDGVIDRFEDSVSIKTDPASSLGQGSIRIPWWATHISLELIFESLPSKLHFEIRDEDNSLPGGEVFPKSLYQILDSNPQALDSKLIDPTHYQTETSYGNFVVFNEGFSPLWKVKAGGEILDTLPGYSFLNLYINKDNLPTEVFISEQNQVNKLSILAAVSWIGVITVSLLYYFYEKKT